MPSTAAAALAVSGDRTLAAIASERAAGRFASLRVLARGVQDGRHNVTRFVILGHQMPQATGADKTSIHFNAPRESRAVGAAADYRSPPQRPHRSEAHSWFRKSRPGGSCEHRRPTEGAAHERSEKWLRK